MASAKWPDHTGEASASQRGRDRSDDRVRTRRRGEVDERGLSPVSGGRLDGQARLADAARTDERHEPLTGEAIADGRELGDAPDQQGERPRLSSCHR